MCEILKMKNVLRLDLDTSTSLVKSAENNKKIWTTKKTFGGETH